MKEKPLNPENAEKRRADHDYLLELKIEAEALMMVKADIEEIKRALAEYETAKRYYIMKWGDKD